MLEIKQMVNKPKCIFLYLENITTENKMSYSKSSDFGLRPGSFERNPNTKSEMKKITTV